ncbi:MAG TPA: hypothetical protein VE973_04315 [Candidatus Limnocylindria bacterium]|nr:hypothetical protein [Candidatus Limnocylindria bacterium]
MSETEPKTIKVAGKSKDVPIVVHVVEEDEPAQNNDPDSEEIN